MQQLQHRSLAALSSAALRLAATAVATTSRSKGASPKGQRGEFAAEMGGQIVAAEPGGGLPRSSWAAEQQRRRAQAALPAVALVGRPNVGKSTLFNRLTRRREALVTDTPGGHVTRDVREGVTMLGGLHFRVLDTAGLEPTAELGSVLSRGATLTKSTLHSCAAALLLVDGRTGVLPADLEVAAWLRCNAHPSMHLVAVVNKAEGFGDTILAAVGEAHALGLGEPLAISAETREGLGDLHDRLAMVLEAAERKQLEAVDGGCAKLENAWTLADDVDVNEATGGATGEDDEKVEGGAMKAEGLTAAAQKLPLQLAVAGLTNVGKSTLVNCMLGEERVLTGPERGLTRDAVRLHFEHQGLPIWLVDTAGWMQRARLTDKATSLAAMDAKRSLLRAHVVLLVLDAVEARPLLLAIQRSKLELDNGGKEGPEASRGCSCQEGRALVIAVNKMDALAPVEQAAARKMLVKAVPQEVEAALPQVAGIPIVYLSAKTGAGQNKLMPAVMRAYERWCTRLPTSQLNRWLLKITARTSAAQGHAAKIRYLTQVKARPPTFVAFITGSNDLASTELRSMASALREDFDLGGVPVRVYFEGKQDEQLDHLLAVASLRHIL
eukprot:SM000012S25345  [mRNA]  locus=s12:529660:533338:+ [translate_table: standard]